MFPSKFFEIINPNPKDISKGDKGYEGNDKKIKDENMPKKIFIISDMKFNMLENTNLKIIERKYKDSGYTMPQIIFWNLNKNLNEIPVTIKDNITIISGFSTTILKSILKDKNIDPYYIVRKTLDKKRYNTIKKSLTN